MESLFEIEKANLNEIYQNNLSDDIHDMKMIFQLLDDVEVEPNIIALNLKICVGLIGVITREFKQMDKKQELIVDELKLIKTEWTRFMMAYEFALQKINTKINILKSEFQYMHDYSPIEHISSRLKITESIVKKVMRKGIPLSLSVIKERIKDIAGIRIICSFRSDIHKLSEMLGSQSDVEVIKVKDYITHPKPNGYQSLHLIVKVPVYMSDRTEHVYVEIQVRTIAMDFWASLEHKIYYKHEKKIPEKLINELREAAISASELDRKMESLHEEVKIFKKHDTDKTKKETELDIPLQLMEEVRKYVDGNKLSTNSNNNSNDEI